MYRIENNEKCNICINNNKIDLSMTAEEMFENAGYKKAREDEKYIVYRVKNQDKKSIYEIQISKLTQEIECLSTTDYIGINMKELKAIYKQVEELGWK